MVSGTLADVWVLAPAVAFAEAFRESGVPLTVAETRGPMGLAKVATAPPAPPSV